jgi:hypothetical protein
VQRGGRHPATAQLQLRPAQAADVLGAEQEVEAAAQRVAVDQQRPAAVAHGGHRDRGGQHRSTRPAAPADHGQHRAAAGPTRSALSGLGECGHQPRLGLGQADDVLGTDRDGLPPHPGRRLAAHRHDHAGPARQRGIGALPGGARVEQHHRRLRPRRAGLGRVEAAQQLAARGRGEPQDRVEQVRVGHHHQSAFVARALRHVRLPRRRRPLRVPGTRLRPARGFPRVDPQPVDNPGRCGQPAAAGVLNSGYV